MNLDIVSHFKGLFHNCLRHATLLVCEISLVNLMFNLVSRASVKILVIFYRLSHPDM